MAYNKIRNLTDIVVGVFNPVAGTSTGTRVCAPSPIRAQILEAGFIPASLVASAMTMQLATDPHISSAASGFATVISSTLGTFSSTNLFEGAVASASPASPTFVNAGDTLQWTASGGNSSAIGAYFYAILRGD